VYDEEWLADALQRDLNDPDQLYAEMTQRSLQATAEHFDVPLQMPDPSPTSRSLA